MRKQSVITLLVAGGLLAASSAFADHNSVWGEGTANMPNDIHNSAIEDDRDVFMDLVQYGDGADLVNRYDDGTQDTSMGGTAASGASATTTMGSADRQSAGARAVTTRPTTMTRVGARR